MKYLTIIIALVLYSTGVLAGNGSFLILKSTYLYQTKDQKGKKSLTRDRRAFEVSDIYSPQGETLMFEIEFTKRNIPVNGSGFIVETETELKELGISEVKVYGEMPTKRSNLTDYQLVPSNQLSFTGRQEGSPDFPKLTWKAVNFKTLAPIRVWIPEWAGVYRPDKSASWLNSTYSSAVTKKLKSNILDKVLKGQVETGFTKDQVRMALGNPVKELLIENDTKLEWIYNSRKVIFINNIVSRVL